MKRKNGSTYIAAALVFTLSLTGCGALNSVDQTLNYVNDTTSYIQEVGSFGSRLSELSQDAVLSDEARTQLENELNGIKDSIEQFAATDAPAYAENLHTNLTEYSSDLGAQVDSLLTRLQSGEWKPEWLEQSQIPELAGDISGLLDQLKNLGGGEGG